ncbi:hypothetical protein OL239_18800 [Arthrobacter sp. ATA002]|uniref:hypothetical protein n=1 Tax=Arthrobacter sp. ATA002 TaxID=2991715 RepID=UPI0022A68024|nr:hypothetical protein [Arthrobacter sp. ATA002]WAP51751.1 hypothetical protein OL239_18800 [Arthrobacter sp. ATA002]
MTVRIAVLADLGQDVYHAGDEAMGHAAADELRRRGLQVLLLSRNPEQTQRLFGCRAAATLPFPGRRPSVKPTCGASAAISAVPPNFRPETRPAP